MKEFYQVCIAYSLFCLCLLGVMAWSVFQDYKYGGNPELEEKEYRVDTIVVYKNGHDYDWELFTQALIWVESKGDCSLKYEAFTLEDRLDSLRSVEMFNIIQDHYNPQHDYHLALKIWNGKAPLSYHRKVMDRFNQIKNEAL